MLQNLSLEGGLSPTFALITFHPSSHKTHECCQQGKAALSSSANCKTIAILGATVRVNGGQVFIAVGNVVDASLVGPEKMQIGEINRLALPSLKLTTKAPENGWLEDDPFLLGLGLFSGANC